MSLLQNKKIWIELYLLSVSILTAKAEEGNEHVSLGNYVCPKHQTYVKKSHIKHTYELCQW